MAMTSIAEILDCLPHRYPFLLIDRILEVEPGKRILALKNVTFNEPHFMGHFPGHPVMPGVLILEAMAQASALLASHTDPANTKGRIVYLMSIDNARFRKPVVPGDQLRVEMTLLKRRREIWRFLGKASTDAGITTEAEIMAMVRHPDAGEPPAAESSS